MQADYRLGATMHGTLDTFGVVEILQMLGRTRRTGTLHIECPERLVDVHFALGRIAETRDSTRVLTDTTIGSQLRRRALVDDVQLEEALAVQETSPRPLGTLLVEAGHLAETDLREVLSRQVASTLVAAKLESTGTFVFVADRDPAPVDFVTMYTHDVLLDISAVGYEYCLAAAALGRTSTVLAHNTDQRTLPGSSLHVGGEEFLVLALVDGRRSVAEITAASGLDELTVVSTLGRFVDAGVLLVRAGAWNGEDDGTDLRAHRQSVLAEISALLDDER
jgi:hypothetical protein